MRRLLDLISELLTIFGEIGLEVPTPMKTVLSGLLIGIFTLAFNVQSVTAVDWPMFRHDLSHTGYSTSLAPSTNNVVWSYTIGATQSSPAIANGKLYIGSSDARVYCLNGATGAYIWSYQTGDYVVSSAAIADGKVYVGSYDNTVYCLDAEGNGDGTTSMIWSYTTGYHVYSSPAVADGRVYVGSKDGKVYAFGLSAPIPTLTEWGLIIFMTLMMGIGVVVLYRRRIA